MQAASGGYRPSDRVTIEGAVNILRPRSSVTAESAPIAGRGNGRQVGRYVRHECCSLPFRPRGCRVYGRHSAVIRRAAG